MLDFNRTLFKTRIANDPLNELIDALPCRQQEPRSYLGASIIGNECLRKTQWDWRTPSTPKQKTQRIFDRGHWGEAVTVALMVQAGFTVQTQAKFNAAGGAFCGHCDGILEAGPELPGLVYPCIWEHKVLGAKGWRLIEKDGLAKAYPHYADQVAIYQAYLDLTNPALFTVMNADMCEYQHILVPFDPVRAQAASDRAVTIIKADAAGETLPRVSDDPEDFRCRFCDHRERCWA